MRIAFLADIHGNLPALEAVLDDAQAQGVDAIATAGDVTSGVWADEVVTRVLDIARWSILGNHESYYIAYDRGTASKAWYTDQNWGAIRWCHNHLSRATLEALAALPEQTVIVLDDAPPIRLLHGSPHGIADRLYPTGRPQAMDHFGRAGFLAGDITPLESALSGVAEPVIVCGHTHIPWVQDTGAHLAVNAGAVSGALNGDWRAQYAILTLTGEPTGWHTEHRAIPYDLDRVREGFERSGYLAEGGAFARAMLLNLETGLNWPGFLLRHIYGHARARGWDGSDSVPDEHWYAGVATFDWGGL
jgi:predicted phosphodiesterase